MLHEREKLQLFSMKVGKGTSSCIEGFNDWGGRRYDDFVPGEVTKIAPSGDETT